MPGPRDTLPAGRITWVRWNRAVAEQYPELLHEITRFDAGPLPAAQAAAAWLRHAGLSGESQPYLAVVDGEIAGYYALTAGQVELSSSHRKSLGLTRPTQGAFLVTWLAKSVRHRLAGAILVGDAVGVAQELAKGVSATVIAFDPFDGATAEMWRERFNMRQSRTTLPARDGEPALKRLYLPLRHPDG